MAKKTSEAFACSNCGAVYAKWLGKCQQCESYNTVSVVGPNASGGRSAELRATRISDLILEDVGQRKLTGIKFLDVVLGGGLPSGTVVLLAGEPGIGKSTLLFQLLAHYPRRSLYISAEESLSQIGRRFRQLKAELPQEMYLLAEHRISEILEQMKILRPEMMVLDSIQMISAEDDRAKGGHSMVRDITDALVSAAKELGITLFIVGHVNKEGDVAGPKTLEHMVDSVLVFSMAEDSKMRILQTQKNRYGPSGEVVLLEMSEKGLAESKEFDSYWLQAHQKQVYGCAIAGVLMGSRIVPVEVQALVVNSYFPSPRRSTTGFDLNRLVLILAVLEKRLKIPFSRFDVYLNVVGGVRIQDPGADMAVAAALVSAYSEKPLLADSVFVGEMGLTGELRPSSLHRDRLQNLSKRGFARVIAPEMNKTTNVEDILGRFTSSGQ